MATARSCAVPVLAIVLLVVVLAAVPPRAAGAVMCGQVFSALSPCIPYTKGMGQLTPGCCNGVKNLNMAAKSTADRQEVCKCLKQYLSNIKGIDLGVAGGIPGKCHVSIPYPISTSVDCNTVK